MSYTAPNRLLMPMRHSIDTISDSWMGAHNAAADAAWPSNNLAIYVPLRVPWRCVVAKLFIASGSAGTNNVDMGLYGDTGIAVISATNQAKVAATDELVFDVTDTTVGPGLYYIAASCDSTSSTFYRWNPAAPTPLAQGVLTEASAYPLPSTATWTANQTNAYIPVMGLLLVDTLT